jgi:putative membrane protein
MRNIGSIIALAIISAPAMAQSTPQSIPPKTPPLSMGRMVATPLSTATFVSRVEDETQFEIQAARLALERAQSPELRQLADRMIKDHLAADEDLKKTIAGPSSAEALQDAAMTEGMELKFKQLQEAWGKAFDAKFIELMTEGHKKDADLFRYYDANGPDPALKIFARRTIPVIESHLRDLEALEKAAKSS